MSTGNGHGPPRRVKSNNKPPQQRVDARLAVIQSFVAAGETTANIIRRVAEITAKEVADRRVGLPKAAAFRELGDEESAAKVRIPPLIWSSNNEQEGTGEPPALRTIERYIHIVKERLRVIAQDNAKEGDLLMGRQLSRLDFLYVQAVGNGKYLTALEVVKEVNRLHGLHGAIRLELSGPQGKPIQHQDATPIATTEPQALAELRRLLSAGAQRAGIELSNVSALLSATSEGAEDVDAELLDEDEEL